MSLTVNQLAFVEKQIKKATQNLKNAKGFDCICSYADLTTWCSHAQLDGWSIEKETGRIYKEKGNVRTYFVKE